MMILKRVLIVIGLITSIHGYGADNQPEDSAEIKEKIKHRLEEMYHGNKFDVWNVNYSDSSGNYIFDYRLRGSDGEYFSSYNLKDDSIKASDHMWDSVNLQWRDIFRPYVNKVSSNFLILGGMGADGLGLGKDVEFQRQKYSQEIGTSLNYIETTGNIEEWVRLKHNYIKGAVSIFIDAPETAEGIYQILQMVDDINLKLRSFHLYSYSLTIVMYKVPVGFNIESYYNKAKTNLNATIDWWFLEGIQKYAWGYLSIQSCTENSGFEKKCNTLYEIKDIKTRESIIDKNTTADKVKDFTDLINDFYIVDKFGEPRECSGLKCIAKWGVLDRANIPLRKSSYYPLLKKLISEHNDDFDKYISAELSNLVYSDIFNTDTPYKNDKSQTLYDQFYVINDSGEHIFREDVDKGAKEYLNANPTVVSKIQNYDVIAVSGDNVNGYTGIVISPIDKDHKAMIISRGTQATSFMDIESDISMGVSAFFHGAYKTNQLKSAEELLQRAKDSERGKNIKQVSTGGHSLGGAIAIALAKEIIQDVNLELGVTYTYNSPGIAKFIEYDITQEHLKELKLKTHIYRVIGDPITAIFSNHIVPPVEVDSFENGGWLNLDKHLIMPLIMKNETTFDA